jgi:hypothetical protein
VNQNSDHWAFCSNSPFPVKVLAQAPDGRSRIVTQCAWAAPCFFRTILVLDGVAVASTEFHSRSGNPAVGLYDEVTETWHGSCLNGWSKPCRWSISIHEQTVEMLEYPRAE